MTNEELLKEINSLPAEAKRMVEDFISQIRNRYSTLDKAHKEKKSFKDDPFFGIWADREDMKEGGAAWVRKIRREQWDRTSSLRNQIEPS